MMPKIVRTQSRRIPLQSQMNNTKLTLVIIYHSFSRVLADISLRESYNHSSRNAKQHEERFTLLPSLKTQEDFTFSEDLTADTIK